jgi:glutathione peroxidase
VTALGDIAFDKTDGTTGTLADHAGEVVLVVNVASKCGLTPQYEALQALYESKRDAGLTILGFPANDFGGQEPGTDAEIAEFCSTRYGVGFPVLSKISVVGPDQHPLYAELTRAVPTADGKADVRWNFEKFLVGRDGRVVARFAPTVAPDDPALVAAVDAELGA